jgi:hypothetical protein
MPQAKIARLTVVWSNDTYLALRSYLGVQRLKRGALSKFVEDAVKWRLFDQSVNQARETLADLYSGELRDTIDEAVANVRKQKRRPIRSRSRSY